jgi:flagella synthesis protein FlgN
METLGTSPAASLVQEREATHALLQLLKQEQTHLVDANVDGLVRLTGEKAKIAAQLSDLAKHRHALLGAAGFDATEAGMKAWLESPAATEADNRSWNELLELALSAKEQNRVNGVLIMQHIARNQTALNVLQGNPQGGNFYGPNGQSTTKIASRRLVVG